MGRKPKEQGHGTYYFYNTRKCRCDDCRRAAAEKRAKYRPVVGSQPKNYSVSYGSIKLRLDAEPLIEFVLRTQEVTIELTKKMKRWRRDGIDVYNADKIAIRFGSHPALIWGRDFYRGCPGYGDV